MHSRTDVRRSWWIPPALLLLGAAVGLVSWRMTLQVVRRPPPSRRFPAPPPATPLSTAEALLHPEASTAACARQLREIGGALAHYRRDHHRLPDQLSDLSPGYLTDPRLFHCPADPTPGEPGRPDLHKDPRLPISYSYEFSADLSRGVYFPLGPFPKSDLPDSQYPAQPNWGTYRHVNEYQQTFFGGWVPVLRCLHHPGADGEEWALNLSLDSRVYPSAAGEDWRNHREVVAAALPRLERDLATGPAALQRRWDLWRFAEYVDGWNRDQTAARLRPLRPQMRALARRLLAIAPKLPALEDREQPTERQRLADEMAAQMLITAGEYRDALAALQAARRLPFVSDRGDAKEQWILADIYRGLGRRENEITLLQQAGGDPLVGQPLDMAGMKQAAAATEPRSVNRYAMERIAAANEALGRPDRAAIYRLLADPTRRLIGRPAPDFTMPTAAGPPIELRPALRGKKALLLDFWADGDTGSQAELPHLQKLYTELSGKGFELIAIKYPGPRQEIPSYQRYLAVNRFTFPVAVRDGDNDVEKEYQVGECPTLYLLDARGRIVWSAAGFHRDDLPAVRAALARLGLT